jgi:hypothetical protein
MGEAVNHWGITKEGKYVQLFPHQVKLIQAFLATAEGSIWVGGRGWGRSTALVTAVELDRHFPDCPRRELVDVHAVCLCND